MVNVKLFLDKKTKRKVETALEKNQIFSKTVLARGKVLAPMIAVIPTVEKKIKKRIVFSTSEYVDSFMIEPSTVNENIVHTKLFITARIAGNSCLGMLCLILFMGFKLFFL